MSIKKAFLVKEARMQGPEAFVRGTQEARTQATKLCQRLADEVIKACQLEQGCKGTLVSALMDAWHQGKYGMRPPQNLPQDVDPNNLPF